MGQWLWQWAVVLIALSLAPAVARGSTWRLVTIAQPVWSEGCVSIREVTYGEGSFVPGVELGLTCEPNAIRMVGEGMDGGAGNRNAANELGLTVHFGPLGNGMTFFDTLAVTLDASRADSTARAKSLSFSPDPVIEATVLCLRINAARTGGQAPPPRMQTKYLDLRVIGPQRLQRFSRLYKVVPLPLPERCYEFLAPAEPK